MKTWPFFKGATTLFVCLVLQFPIANAGPHKSDAAHRDKSGTSRVHKKYTVSEVESNSAITARSCFGAEGTGFEPATGCPASDFESDR